LQTKSGLKFISKI